MNPLIKYFRFLWSLKFAVVVLVALAAASAVGTVLESKLDTQTAGFWVYNAYWFYIVLASLAVNILAVALSRWPWQQKHIPFLLAHAGIIMMLVGGTVTKTMGIDGSVLIEEGATENTVEFQSTELVLSSPKQTVVEPIRWVPMGMPFLKQRISEFGVVVDDFIAHAAAENQFVAVDAREQSRAVHAPLPAIKVQLDIPSQMAQMMPGLAAESPEFWLWLGDPAWSATQIGPARFMIRDRSLSKASSTTLRGLTGAEFVIDGARGFEVISHSKRGTQSTQFVSAKSAKGAAIDPHWPMPIKLRVLEYLPNARRLSKFVPAQEQYGQRAPGSAVRITSKDAGSFWLGLEERSMSSVNGEPFLMQYRPRRIQLPFELHLQWFKIDHDQGTNNPAAYASMVTVIDDGKPVMEAKVHMNHPLKYRGFTFYQASYIQEPGMPTATVLSVNRDPGRFLKYSGAILIVLGSILLFASKRRKGKTA